MSAAQPKAIKQSHSVQASFITIDSVAGNDDNLPTEQVRHVPATSRTPATKGMAGRSVSRWRNAVYAGGLIVLAGTFALAPLYFTERNKNNNLTFSDKALVGSQIMRGAYINSGSKDAGPDPDWDPVTRVYRGRSLANFAPSDADVEAHRQALRRKRAAAGLHPTEDAASGTQTSSS